MKELQERKIQEFEMKYCTVPAGSSQLQSDIMLEIATANKLMIPFISSTIEEAYEAGKLHYLTPQQKESMFKVVNDFMRPLEDLEKAIKKLSKLTKE